MDKYGTELVAAADEPFKAYEAMRTDWRNEIIKDPHLGNGKDNIKPEVKAELGRVYAAMGDPALIQSFKEAMDLTGAGDHPAFVRGIRALSKFVTEGQPATGGPALPKAKAPSAAQAIYPNLTSAG
jgi:hypothetical protein